MEKIVVRFAPSPTGYLHIGGARTALMNWLYAKKYGGKFLLRIEDTDTNRSDQRCTDAILESLSWLGINYDGDLTIQSKNISRHCEVANKLLSDGKAYKCYCTSERLKQLREEQISKKIPPRYDHFCREIKEVDDTKPYVIRLKVPEELSYIEINDIIKGKVRVNNNDLDDFIILRSDQTPIYLLSVVVDDHNSGVTHCIRGDDHFTNTFRQILIYQACGWELPIYAHLPLIHGPNGGKLSKRDGAVGVHEYKNLGYLPQAMLLYLFSLGFGDKAKNIEDMISKFDLTKISKSPSRMDLKILNTINARIMKSDKLINYHIMEHPCAKDLPHDILLKAIPELLPRSQTIVQLIELFKKVYLMESPMFLPHLDLAICQELKMISKDFNEEVFLNENSLKQFINLRIGNNYSTTAVLEVLRWLITKQESSPNIYRIMLSIGPKESSKRLMKETFD